jgi:hypothetical protein
LHFGFHAKTLNSRIRTSLERVWARCYHCTLPSHGAYFN